MAQQLHQAKPINELWERMVRTVIRLTETNLYLLLALIQIPVIADLSLWHFRQSDADVPVFLRAAAALLFPIVNALPGAIDPVLTDWHSVDEIRFGIEQAELRTIGAVILGGYVFRRISQHLSVVKGEMPIMAADGILFLDMHGPRVESAFSQRLQEHCGCELSNLYYASLFRPDSIRPATSPAKAFRGWYAEEVDPVTDAANTEVLGRAGALRASCVIAAVDSEDMLRVNALSIELWRSEMGLPPCEIVAISQAPLAVYQPFPDRDFGDEIAFPNGVTIDQYRAFCSHLGELLATNDAGRCKAVTFFVEGVPHTRASVRTAVLYDKATRIRRNRNGDVRVFLNGAKCEMQALLARYLTAQPGFALTDAIRECDLIVSHVDPSQEGDVAINRMADEANRIAPADTLHLYLVYGMGNEDNASMSADGGTSIERLLVDELVMRASRFAKPKMTFGNVARSVVARVRRAGQPSQS